ncbi:MAG: diguanylate cyclase [Phenylobacterium sp.]|nr:diguanylate cyclase [Phenylobacterium sp.]
MPDQPPPIDREPLADAPANPAHEAWLAAVLESVSDAFYALDTSWRYVVFNRAAEEYFGVRKDRILGKTFAEVFPQGLGTDFEARLKAAMTERTACTYEVPSAARPDRMVELRINPMRDGGIAVSLRDITERKQAERRQRLLVNELNHRVKNALATVQAIAAQSLRGADLPQAAFDRFMARLMALARANDILVAEDWLGAELDAIATQVASPYVAEGEVGRFRVGGPEAHLAPKAATAVALALHELATNAAKYGALSTTEGQVSLTWALDGEGAARRLHMSWRESGGPPVTPPQKAGFGTRLIEKGLKAELQADVRLDYAESGLVMTLDAPLPEPPQP